VEQASFFDDETDAEFEIERPMGAPQFHSWLLATKFRMATTGLGESLAGKVVLIVCGGSGLDAEFFAREGAIVVTSDISLGAALRASERARRHQFDVVSIVADANRLPFASEGVDICYVHDGLHHLETPEVAVREMARVARFAVSITEPARAAVTMVAIRLGIAETQEEAGNAVRRFACDELLRLLKDEGFSHAVARRYAMFYRHKSGLPSRMLSVRGGLGLVKTAFFLLNWAIGRWGNKVVVQGSRR
jgi:ubiquinone/menaquinone biosynthesis C-methylase UbiE